jgi:hypothetical protein
MPVDTKPKTVELSELFARRVQTVEIEITPEPGDTFSVTYKPDAFTKAVQAEIQAAETEDAASVLLLRLIAKWSLVVDGEPYPVTKENLEALGFPLLMAISTVVNEDFNSRINLGKVTSNGSSEDSSGH